MAHTASAHNALSSIRLRDGIIFDNQRPMVLIGGMNVIEGRDVLLRVAEHFVTVTRRLQIPLCSRPALTRPTAPHSIPFAGQGWRPACACWKR
jgi:2-dehydro-3-deoxyphosphooctonate aldolase (KDO 8-P synthase)